MIYTIEATKIRSNLESVEVANTINNYLLTESAEEESSFEESYLASRVGLKLIEEAAADPTSYNIYEKDGKYYIPATSIQRYCEATGNFDVKEAIGAFQEANNITSSTIVYDYCDEAFVEFFEEAGIVLEKAAEDDAMTLKQAMKWYGKFVTKSKTKLEGKKDIEERIAILEKCIKDMERAKKNTEGEKTKYALKAMIPFNDLYRLIKRKDAYAGLGWIGGIAGSVIGIGLPVDIGIRYVNFEKMLDAKIEQTKEAIKFLKEKLKEYK